MKILIINGSPKGFQQYLKLTKAFVEGMGDHEIKEITVSKLNISAL